MSLKADFHEANFVARHAQLAGLHFFRRKIRFAESRIDSYFFLVNSFVKKHLTNQKALKVLNKQNVSEIIRSITKMAENIFPIEALSQNPDILAANSQRNLPRGNPPLQKKNIKRNFLLLMQKILLK